MSAYRLYSEYLDDAAAAQNKASAPYRHEPITPEQTFVLWTLVAGIPAGVLLVMVLARLATGARF